MEEDVAPKPERNLNRFGIGLFAFFALFMGGMSIYHAIVYRKAIQSRSWPTAPATLTKWEMEKWESRKKNKWLIKCEYIYRIDNTVYVGKRLRISPSGNDVEGSPDYADSLNERYRQGGSYDIRYNPRNPEDSVLEPGPDSWVRSEYSLMYGGAIACVLFLCIIVWGVRFPREARSPNG